MASTKMAKFGRFIKNLRESLGWTQTELGAKIGINSGAISKIENGKIYLNPDKLPIIADVFNKDLSTVKEIYYADKFAREAYENNCPNTVFAVAEEQAKYIAALNSKQSKLEL